MRIKRKVIQVIEMSEQEIEKLFELATKAKEGHVSHYAETEMSPGKFLGVSISPEYNSINDKLNMPKFNPKY